MTDLTKADAASDSGWPWAQRRDEPAELHAYFRQWLRLNPRPTPAECNAVEIAAQFDWMARAHAYDTACELILDNPNAGVKEHWLEMSRDWAMLTRIESKKLRDASLSSKAPVLGAQDLLGWHRAVADIARDQAELTAQQGAYDIGQLTPEERAEVDRLLEKAKVEK